ncbi:phage tail protein [Erythrobacter dokdonensis]|uniref:Phage-tail_3 domain-containing protein n=1 Tax=Erythrobacter dokdonensis DSW-74 TaxID=1300349 RepID=A0A1A7BFF5_9SPHN|nr:phage tail protein [Erythrobacter dokdonensis]OBV09955.1 Phage-tail_3 domain-containing protein [Erythrobacter dokdonensis DSW-74]
MATLLLTALGTAIGGPIGGTIGALIGRQADAAIFGGGSRQGPRLRELTVSTSSYGQPLARHFGRMRVPGTIIWSTDLIESKRKQKGRKGQPSTVTYSYSASFAVALSSTPLARLGRIWADGNLLRGALDDLKVAGKIRFYHGYGDDPVDPLIAADKGGLAPAFRDCAYVVFEELELGDFGNRIPALSFEIFAEGGETSVSLELMVPGAAEGPSATFAHLRGYADDGGPLAATLATIDEIIPLVCISGRDGLRIAPRALQQADIITLPQQLFPDERSGNEGRHKQRAAPAAREPAALRYYDEGRDYQPGVQRALGSRRYGRETMFDLPATLTADGARQLANRRATRARWQNETVLWRIGELDPRLQPGAAVRLPTMRGVWFISSWEWFEGGVELSLERVAPELTAQTISDPGDTLPPADEPMPPTRLEALEVPGDGNLNPASPLLFAATSAAHSGWRGAALYLAESSRLIPIGSSGTQRAVMGALLEPLAPSSAVLFEPTSSLLVELVGEGLDFADTDVSGLANGANRLMVGGEVVQFARAEALGERQWRLQGLLRGRGGTEAEAATGHSPQTSVILLDDSLVALDPADVPPLATTRIAAIGPGDPEIVIAELRNPGLSRRPLAPVHARLTVTPGNRWELCWTRRARGQWRWEDLVEVPLVEEQEQYLVGYGPALSPFVAWSVNEPRFELALEERSLLISTHGTAALWVRQIGTFGQSHPLFLAHLS